MSSKLLKPSAAQKASTASHTTLSSTTPTRSHRPHPTTSTSPSTATQPPPPPVFLTLSPSSFASLTLTARNFFHVSVGRINGRLMALPVVLECHTSLLVAGGADSAVGGRSVSGSVVLGRLFAHLPSLIADVNVAKLKNVKDKPNLLETDKVGSIHIMRTQQIVFTYQFRETHSKYHIMTLVPPHSSVPRAHYPDIDSEADVSSDDLRDPDDDEADSEDDTRQQQQHQRHDEGDGYYKGGKYRAFQVSKHSLYVRAIARYREEVAGEERKERTEDRGKEERLDDGEHREERASDRKGGKREKEGMDETEEEEEESTRKKKHKRDDKSKGDRKSKNGGRRRSVTVLDDDDDFV